MFWIYVFWISGNIFIRIICIGNFIKHFYDLSIYLLKRLKVFTTLKMAKVLNTIKIVENTNETQTDKCGNGDSTKHKEEQRVLGESRRNSQYI